MQKIESIGKVSPKLIKNFSKIFTGKQLQSNFHDLDEKL